MVMAKSVDVEGIRVKQKHFFFAQNEKNKLILQFCLRKKKKTFEDTEMNPGPYSQAFVTQESAQ